MAETQNAAATNPVTEIPENRRLNTSLLSVPQQQVLIDTCWYAIERGEVGHHGVASPNIDFSDGTGTVWFGDIHFLQPDQNAIDAGKNSKEHMSAKIETIFPKFQNIEKCPLCIQALVLDTAYQGSWDTVRSLTNQYSALLGDPSKADERINILEKLQKVAESNPNHERSAVRSRLVEFAIELEKGYKADPDRDPRELANEVSLKLLQKYASLNGKDGQITKDELVMIYATSMMMAGAPVSPEELKMIQEYVTRNYSYVATGNYCLGSQEEIPPFHGYYTDPNKAFGNIQPRKMGRNGVVTGGYSLPNRLYRASHSGRYAHLYDGMDGPQVPLSPLRRVSGSTGRYAGSGRNRPLGSIPSGFSSNRRVVADNSRLPAPNSSGRPMVGTSLPCNRDYESPNQSNRTEPIDTIVIHQTCCSVGATINTFESRKEEKSAHYVIDKEGNIYQMVGEERVAWHAGDSFLDGRRHVNGRSIGIELVMIDDEPPTPKQQAAVMLLTNDIKQRHPGVKHVVTHADITPDGRKDDPRNCLSTMIALEKAGLAGPAKDHVYPIVERHEELENMTLDDARKLLNLDPRDVSEKATKGAAVASAEHEEVVDLSASVETMKKNADTAVAMAATSVDSEPKAPKKGKSADSKKKRIASKGSKPKGKGSSKKEESVLAKASDAGNAKTTGDDKTVADSALDQADKKALASDNTPSKVLKKHSKGDPSDAGVAVTEKSGVRTA